MAAGETMISEVAWGKNTTELLTGDGSNYRGQQQRTRTGRKCLNWDAQTVMPEYNSANYEVLRPATATKNYCRNPYNATDEFKPRGIWCVTSDPDVPWEECVPIGIIQPECIHGYEITGQNMRDALWYSSFVVWALGGLWFLVILCFVSRIRLAIALNKVAAVYVATNPSTLLIPVVQAVMRPRVHERGCLWRLVMERVSGRVHGLGV